MSRTEWVIALATIGFLAEVAGVGLIVLDIRDSRRQGRRIVERGQRHRIEQVVGTNSRLPCRLSVGSSHRWTSASPYLRVGIRS